MDHIFDTESMLLSNATADEYVNFIKDQIRDPFDGSTSNYFRRLTKLLSDPEVIDKYCLQFLDDIENVYSGLDFDLSDYDFHLTDFFNAVYKFFVKNTATVMYVFLREYIFTSKNRKSLVGDYLNSKLPNYPKEQYGKKEYYILINKLQSIIKDIRREKLNLGEFIHYLKRADDTPGYIKAVEKYYEEGLIDDQTVVTDLFDLLFDSDQYAQIYNKLQMAITTTLINPYLEESGMSSMRLPQVEEQEDELTDDDEEENNEEEN